MDILILLKSLFSKLLNLFGNLFAEKPSQSDLKSYKDLPGPKIWPFIGSFLDFQEHGGVTNIHKSSVERHKKYGSMYRDYLGGVNFVHVSHPDLFKELRRNEGEAPGIYRPPEENFGYELHPELSRGLIFSVGETWATNRAKFNKIFLKNTHTLDETFNALDNLVAETLQKWEKSISQNNGVIPNAKFEFYHLFMNSQAAIQLGEKRDEFYSSALLTKEELAKTPLVHAKAHSDLYGIPLKLAHFLGLKAWKTFEDSWLKQEHTSRNWVKNALDNYNFHTKEKSLAEHGLLHKFKTETDFTDSELVSFQSDFIMLSLSSIMNTFWWLMYSIGRYPDVQQKLFEEIADVTQGERFSYQHASHVSYLRLVIKESMRMYPTAPFLARTFDEDFSLGGYSIPPGVFVIMSSYAAHMDERNFPEPNKFWPERWQAAQQGEMGSAKSERFKGVLNPDAFVGFGVGKRACLGKKIAEMNMIIYIGQLLQKFKIKCEETEPTMERILIPKEYVDFVLTPRT